VADCLVSFGSNVGDGRAAYSFVRDFLRNHSNIQRVRASSLIKTRPIGGDPVQAEYLNGAIRFEVDLSPVELFRVLRSAESSLGRVRDRRWGPRTVDLDLLLFDRLVDQWEIDSQWLLEIPHPRMSFRRFVLKPAAEIAADMFHGEAQMTIEELLRHLDDRPNIVAIFDDAERISEMLRSAAVPAGMPRAEHVESPIHRVEIQRAPAPENFPSLGRSFAVVPIASPAHWSQIQDQCKLIVYWKEPSEKWKTWSPDVVRTVSGPRLALGPCAMVAAAEEIDAALASMIASSVEL
jgi:2-amino-4-hydroxy-6-hydroxymethyldihydropteridine diphosphokinase